MVKKISKLGFGSSRVAKGNLIHEQALHYALSNGVTLIDTSTHFTNGLSEKLIGKVIANFNRDSLTIVSKFGYIQDDLLDKVKLENQVNDIVKCNEKFYHSIDATFMQDELANSLQRLNLDYIDTYLLNDPQYYLITNLKNEKNMLRHQKEMFTRIYKVFVALEKEVKQGRIRGYGINSSSFSLSENDLYFLDFDLLINSAKLAAQETKNKKHHFTTIELPINLLQLEGLKYAQLAKKHNITVIANKVLNASLDTLFYRLATYEFPKDYDRLLNETLLFIESNNLQVISNIISELDLISHKFRYVGDYEIFLVKEILPALKNILKNLEFEAQNSIISALEPFFKIYAQKVSFEASKTTLKSLNTLGFDIKHPIQKDALNFLFKNKNIDSVLLGMRKISYVQESLSILED